MLESKMYNPALLPQVEKVVILNLGDNLQDVPSKYVSLGKLSMRTRTFTIYATVEAEGDEAAEIAEMWRQLPQAEQMRCHIPPYGLRFYGGGQVIIEASVCWLCNNIAVMEKGSGSTYYTFDASAEVSQHLLEKLREIAARNPPAMRGMRRR
jgi:hypothetical protein